MHAKHGADIKAFANVELAFDDIPEVLAISPDNDEDLLGVGTVHVVAQVLDRGEASVKLEIDGVDAGTKTNTECLAADGCAFEFLWDTSVIAAGSHSLKLTISDADGHAKVETRTVRIDDLLKITSMNVTAIDDGGLLEMEVYLYDNATNALLGCAGSAHGLGPVNAADVRYAVDAILINPSGQKLRVKDLANKSIRFEVREDDDAPVCPTPAGSVRATRLRSAGCSRTPSGARRHHRIAPGGEPNAPEWP
ncbi:MAG: hypothetical protein ABI867_05995 [Kofleriaceae bacterium]